MSSSISRKKILKALNDAREPLSLPELSSVFGVNGKKAGQQILDQLNSLILAGTIIRNRRNRFALSDKMDMVSGVVIGHRDGYGFVERSGEGKDLYLSSREMQRVLHGDKVLARVKRIDSRGRHEATLVALIEQGLQQVVGRFRQDRGVGYVIPDDSRISRDIMIQSGDQSQALDGQIVVAQITTHPFEARHLQGRVVEILGDHMAAGMETEIAIRKHGIPYQWPDDVVEEVERSNFELDEILPTNEREDLRELPLVTIDGADARDFDDAVCAVRQRSGWKLWVAIADVSHYVVPGCALDACASERGNSVYFPGRVIPMLPEVLSNGICSLNPEVNRYSLVCEMKIADDGEVTAYRFCQGLIRSSARLTYESAQRILDDDKLVADIPADALENVRELAAVYGVLRERRFNAGSLDLDIAEPQFFFDQDRRITRIESRTRLDSHRLIEECMLAANVCAARFIAHSVSAGMYRIHDRPDEERFTDLRRVYSGFGIPIEGGSEPAAQDLMRAVQHGREHRADVAQTLQMLVLRTMKQAVYSVEPSLHFALGYEFYTHFTSPIRRYPDLVVHRLIKSILKVGGKSGPLQRNELEDTAQHCSQTERRAEEATRDVYQWLKAEYMLDRVGQSFDGKISSITQFGAFVVLDDVYVDGLVHISELGKDYFHFDPIHLTLSGERTGKVYRLGDPMRIQVAAVDLDEGKIDFVPAQKKSTRRKSGKWDRT